MRQLIYALLLVLGPSPLWAAGLQINDLTRLKLSGKDIGKPGYIVKSAPKRVIITCAFCKRPTMVDIRLGKSTD